MFHPHQHYYLDRYININFKGNVNAKLAPFFFKDCSKAAKHLKTS